MVNNDKVWRWDDSKAVRTSSLEAQESMDALLMKAAGVDDPDEAVTVLMGKTYGNR
jgi:hypothetical protein